MRRRQILGQQARDAEARRLSAVDTMWSAGGGDPDFGDTLPEKERTYTLVEITHENGRPVASSRPMTEAEVSDLMRNRGSFVPSKIQDLAKQFLDKQAEMVKERPAKQCPKCGGWFKNIGTHGRFCNGAA